MRSMATVGVHGCSPLVRASGELGEEAVRYDCLTSKVSTPMRHNDGVTLHPFRVYSGFFHHSQESLGMHHLRFIMLKMVEMLSRGGV